MFKTGIKFFSLLSLFIIFSAFIGSCAGRLGKTSAASQTIIIGQSGFSENKANRGKSVAAHSLNEPWDVTIDTTNSRIYVADTKNNRVLRWDTITPTANDNANLVLGQVNFTSGKENRDGDPDADTLKQPKGVHVAGTTVAVADTGNNRVLIWTSLPTANGQDANIVLGQDDDDLDGNFFNDNLPNQGGNKPDQNTLKEPVGVFIDTVNSRLIIADSGNNRILVWNTLTPANGADANLVVGQEIEPGSSDDPFVYNSINNNNDDVDDDGIPDPDSNSLFTEGISTGTPKITFTAGSSVFLTGTNFFIDDQNNSRVLVYNVWPLVANADGSTSSVAIGCIGQTAFNKRFVNQVPGNKSGTPNNNNLNYPFDMFSDGTRVWVSDTKNNRLIRFDSIPTACNAPAGTVIGQLSRFDGGSGVGPNRFNTPRGIFEVVSGTTRFLWIADSLNHRVIRITDS
ncbi:MAG: hypothetical protein A3F16_03875 [Deltaproteobacteria bacterium RIFCSPHIGHO2_12_FULL_43_9]|nr:MAG: hypothetical protein A3F16_03875 [Deltaproteobacteria bacterium RIFCSPHIGHO2_12_FULL_43_9]